MSFDDSLPDVSAFPAALFSKLPEDVVYEIIKDRFNIEYDDVLREGVEKMSSLREDTYNWGFREGKEEGRQEGSVNSLSDFLISYIKEKNIPVDEIINSPSIPEDLRELVRKEVYRKLGY